MSHVSDNPDHRDPVRFVGHSSHDDPFSQWLLIWPKLPGKRLIDNNDGRRVRVIGISKKPALEQRRLQSAEVVRRNFALFFVGAWALVCPPVALR